MTRSTRCNWHILILFSRQESFLGLSLKLELQQLRKLSPNLETNRKMDNKLQDRAQFQTNQSPPNRWCSCLGSSKYCLVWFVLASGDFASLCPPLFHPAHAENWSGQDHFCRWVFTLLSKQLLGRVWLSNLDYPTLNLKKLNAKKTQT